MTDARPHLRGLRPEELASTWADLRLEPGLARRIVARLVGRDGEHLDGLPGLSPRLAAELMRRARMDRLEVVQREASRVDPFVKYLFRSGDGQVFEAVRIPLERPRWKEGGQVNEGEDGGGDRDPAALAEVPGAAPRSTRAVRMTSQYRSLARPAPKASARWAAFLP